MILIWVKFLLIAVSLCSLAGLLGQFHRLFELASHFKFQYTIGSGVCLILFASLQAWVWVLPSLLLVIINGVALWPYLVAQPQSDLPGSLRLMHFNINYHNSKFSALIKYVKEESPDILIVQEITPRGIEQLQVLRQEYPYSISEKREKGKGIALFSRIPFAQTETLVFDDDGRPSFLAELKVDGKLVSLLTTHPSTPMSAKKFRRRNRHLSGAADVMQSLPEPKILIGDLNMTMWSYYFIKLLRETGLVDPRRGVGLLASWPTFMLSRRLLMIPIDHCLVSSDIAVTKIYTGRHIGSDHLPLIVDLSIKS